MRILILAAIAALIPAGASAQPVARTLDCPAGVGVLDVDSNATTEWQTLTSLSFDDLAEADGGKLGAGLVFTEIVAVNTGGGAMRVKLRAAAAVDDTTANRLLVPANSAVTRRFRGRAVTSISYAKLAAGVTGQLVACFDRPGS